MSVIYYIFYLWWKKISVIGGFTISSIYAGGGNMENNKYTTVFSSNRKRYQVSLNASPFASNWMKNFDERRVESSGLGIEVV